MTDYSLDLSDPKDWLEGDDHFLRGRLGQLVDEESVITLDDLLHRWTNWGSDPQVAEHVARRIHGVLGNDRLKND